MPSHGAQKRREAEALRAYNLSLEGYTHKQIAALIGKEPERVKTIIERGERVASITPQSKGDERG